MVRRGKAAALGVAALATFFGLPASAQEPVAGRIYYAVENRDLGRVTERGVAGSSGTPFTNLVLSPGTRYRVWILHAETLNVGWAEFRTPTRGSTFTIPPISLGLPSSHDLDGDQLHDQGEFILNTNPRKKDTDGDGVEDGPEVRAGTNPLDGLEARTGTIASADTPGTAVDVCASNELVVVADGSAGITAFNVFNGMDPRAIARVATTDARRVSCSGTRVAVADGPGGLLVVDLSDPPAAQVVHVCNKFLIGGEATAVAAIGRLAFVGTSTGKVVSVNLQSGALLESVHVGTRIKDLFVAGDTLYAIDGTKLYTLAYLDALGLRVVGSVAVPNPRNDLLRVFAGAGRAHVVDFSGVTLVDVSDPAQPALVSFVRPGGQFGWEHVVLDGAGLAVAAVGGSSAGSANRDVSVHALDPQGNLGGLIATHATPGRAAAVSLYNGLVYSADSSRGLQVVRVLPLDSADRPPTVALDTSFGLTSAEEGKFLRVSARVSDDVQLRNVEFFLDGRRVETDGNFPYQFGFTAPLLSEQTSFRLRARAFDTGGNSTFTQEFTIQLTPDATPPAVRGTSPRNGAVLGRVDSIALLVTEPLDPATLTEANLSLVGAGPDRTFGTADDVAVGGGAIEFREEVLGAFRSFAAPLASGRYRAQATARIADLRGNTIAAAETWEFEVFDVKADRDGDGVPDALEAALGLDPDDPDSDGDGTPDGLEDFDGDGLVNAAEVLFGTDPLDGDTDGNGVSDGDEDRDTDSLVDREEFDRGTDPFDPDTDKDKFEDGVEVAFLSDPLDPTDLPLRYALQLVRGRNDGAASLGRAAQSLVVENRGPESLDTALQQLTVENRGPESLDTALQQLTVENEGPRTIDAAFSSIVVKNEAAPEGTAGSVEGKTFTVENRAP
ncbi:MAG: hypothetical protein D6731_22230 [Planctomycetota bacterium]|nr:MAG: hypothetical protein D6731_22230 [Planctomycetota bacterium]